MFLEKFFPASRVTTIRKEICDIRQLERESLLEYWEMFKRLCVSCPYHQIHEQLLIQYFYKGLMFMDRQMINIASGRALVDKTPTSTRLLIENMASNNQHFGTRSNSITLSRGVYEINTSYVAYHNKLESKLDDLATLFKQVAKTQVVAKLCGICTSIDHPTDTCPTLNETGGENTESPQVYDANIYNKGRQSNQQCITMIYPPTNIIQVGEII